MGETTGRTGCYRILLAVLAGWTMTSPQGFDVGMKGNQETSSLSEVRQMLTCEKGIGGPVVQFPASARIFPIANPQEPLQFRSREPTAAPVHCF